MQFPLWETLSVSRVYPPDFPRLLHSSIPGVQGLLAHLTSSFSNFKASSSPLLQISARELVKVVTLKCFQVLGSPPVSLNPKGGERLSTPPFPEGKLKPGEEKKGPRVASFPGERLVLLHVCSIWQILDIRLGWGGSGV